MCLLTAWMTSKTFWNQFWSYKSELQEVMCPRLIWICFPDSRKYKFFEGLRLIFWPSNFWPLTSSSEWFLRITAKKWVNVYKFNMKKRRETSGISLFCSNNGRNLSLQYYENIWNLNFTSITFTSTRIRFLKVRTN